MKMPNSPAPSMRAASASSSGIVMKNCRIMKMKNALPKAFGTTSGRYEFSQPRLLNVMNSGTIVTCHGSMMVIRQM